MGSSTTTGTTTSSGSGGAPQVIPQLNPFLTRIGDLATQGLADPNINLSRLSADFRQQIPGLAPTQQGAIDTVADWQRNGMGTPFPEQMAALNLEGLPQRVGAPVNQSPFMGRALGTAEMAADNMFSPNAQQQSGVTGMSQFLPGGNGMSPAFEQALQGLQNQIVPAVQNSAAKMGLGQSGFLPMEIGRQYAQNLVPLYQQAMTQQQAAGNQMFGAGSTLQNQAFQGAQNLQNQQTGLGMNEQQLQSDALQRQMQAAIQSATPLGSFSQGSTNRQVLPVTQGLTAGATERGVQSEQSQADLNQYLRQRELGMSLINPFGSYSSAGAVPSTSGKQTTTTPLGIGK